jgi:hypothetical protein
LIWFCVRSSHCDCSPRAQKPQLRRWMSHRFDEDEEKVEVMNMTF